MNDKQWQKMKEDEYSDPMLENDYEEFNPAPDAFWCIVLFFVLFLLLVIWWIL